MKKNQIFIKCGTEYKEMTKELLEACDLEGEIEKKFETKSSLIDNSEAEVDCFYSSDSVENQNSEFGLYNMQIGIKPNLVAPMEAYWGGTTHPKSGVSSPSVKNITFRSLTCKKKRVCLYNVAI